MPSHVAETFDRYQEETSDADFTGWLQVLSEPNWSEGVDHQFVHELADGTIDDEVYGRYLIQDRAFVETLIGLYGHAIGVAPTLTQKQRIHRFLSMLVDDDVDSYFAETFEKLGVPENEWVDPELHPVTEGLMDIVERGAREGDYEETLAVLFPTGWFYLAWAESVEDAEPAPYLREWIDVHTTDELKSFVAWQHDELNRLGPKLIPRRQRLVGRHFRRTMAYEKAFFDIAYDPKATV